MKRELTKREIKLELESLILLIDNGSSVPFATSIREDIDHLRICISYNNLDLEATRRELKVARELGI